MKIKDWVKSCILTDKQNVANLANNYTVQQIFHGIQMRTKKSNLKEAESFLLSSFNNMQGNF